MKKTHSFIDSKAHQQPYSTESWIAQKEEAQNQKEKENMWEEKVHTHTHIQWRGKQCNNNSNKNNNENAQSFTLFIEWNSFAGAVLTLNFWKVGTWTKKNKFFRTFYIYF